jgi:hypothetical protein
MRTLATRLTRADAMTAPGGIILRKRDTAFPDEPAYIVHSFIRGHGDRKPCLFFWGSYHETIAEAWEAFDEKEKRARRYAAGGALIERRDEARELELEELAALERGEA